ncbi:hypothetical protein A2970_01070 [Candidatus Roizmanbacteria bacterium RIFCSPLOWO2_01_FULL_44_13]|uniref:Uncharacterized protein n=1 Tax=Candidatus Roizmanbacteria bacterium RIFCSPLOWO2_01_FULL_44_13 TaxID=1802069 RepID=A0A1F7JAA6_9BACT|nr:MAG: hypothetical protein A2970_01070 [Candidatus Roizmanbacteria bacterium RIFCSPLOWO2_01_FULL_44_13]
MLPKTEAKGLNLQLSYGISGKDNPVLIDTNQYINTVANLIMSDNKPRVDLGLKYFPNLLERLEPLASEKQVNLDYSYFLFRPIILTAPSLNPEQKNSYTKTIKQHDLTIYSVFSKQIVADPYFQTGEWLQRHSFKMLGLTSEETKQIILSNWQKVSAYIVGLTSQGHEMNFDILREISFSASNNLLPSFALGFRFDHLSESLDELRPTLKEIDYRYRFLRAHGTPADNLEATISRIIQKANSQIKSENNNRHFEKQIASLAAEYVSAHPHPDGNGTKTLFFIDACMALKGGYVPISEYEVDIDKRALQILRGNKTALKILNLKTMYRMVQSHGIR